MMPLTERSALWLAVILAEVTLFVVLILRAAFRRYPAFTCFIVFCVARSLILLYLNLFYKEFYVLVNWTSYAPQLVILVALVFEVFHALFHPLDSFPQHTVANFITATLTVLSVVALFTVLHPRAQTSAWMTFARALDQCVSTVLCGIFALIILFAHYFGVSWRDSVYGIGTGFAFFLSIESVVCVVVTQYKLATNNSIWLIHMLGFFIACMIWIYYFGVREPVRTPPRVEQLKTLMAQIDQQSSHLRSISARNARFVRGEGRFCATEQTEHPDN